MMETIDNIDLGESFHGEGWYEAEGDPNQPIRWMKSGCVASISVIAELSKAVQVECHIVSIVRKEVLENLDIKVDGELVEYFVSQNSSGLSLSFLVGKRPLTPITDITFSVSKIFTPDGPDERTLSLAFRKIMVNQLSYQNVLASLGFKVGN